MKDLQNKVMGAIILASILGGTAMAYASSGNLSQVSSNLGISQTEIKDIIDKQEAGETLSTYEQKIFDQVKQQMENKQGYSRKGLGVMGEKKGFMGNPMMQDLTDEEKTALDSMTDEQKQQFFDTKREEMEAKMEVREAVIDKKLNDESLTDEEKVVLEDIKTQRAEMKAKKAEQKAAFDAIKPVLEKKRNGETLSADEQSQLDAFEAKFPHPGKDGMHKGGQRGFGRGEDR